MRAHNQVAKLVANLTIFVMSTLSKKFLLAVSFSVFLTECTEHLIQNNSSPEYQTKKFERKQRNAPPIIFGSIDQKEPDGRTYPVKLAKILVNGNSTDSEPTGYYSRVLTPGEHNLSVAWPGLRTVAIKGLSLQKGDSVRIDFHLQADTAQFRN